MLLSPIVGFGVLRVISSQTESMPAQELPWRAMAASIIERVQIEVVEPDEAELIDWLESHRMVRRMFTLQLSDVFGRQLITPEIDAAYDDAAWHRIEFTHADHDYVAAFFPTFLSARGSAVGLQPPMAMLLFRSEYRWLLLAISVALTVGLSLLIARYLVTPLREFERAGEALAAGDLSARVAPSLGNRADEIADFAATFDSMAVRLQALVQSHKTLLRDVSHELRSPLARVLAAVSLARQRTNGDGDAEFRRIELEIERLNAMIGKLLSYARLDARQPELILEPVRVDTLLAGIVESTSIEATAGSKRIEMQTNDIATVNGDGELLGSALENIVRNAISFAPDETCIEIALSVDSSADICRISVRDHGDGVSEGELSRIFDPFYRSDEGRGATTGGTGIGLAIAQKAVVLHRGRISAHNHPSGGLVVCVDLPVAQTNAVHTPSLFLTDANDVSSYLRPELERMNFEHRRNANEQNPRDISDPGLLGRYARR